MHPLEHYTLFEFEQAERLRALERERQRRERHALAHAVAPARRIGHVPVAPARANALERLAATLLGRPDPRGRLAQVPPPQARSEGGRGRGARDRLDASAGRSDTSEASIGCRA